MNFDQRLLFNAYTALVTSNGTSVEQICETGRTEEARAAREAFEASRVKHADVTVEHSKQRNNLLRALAKVRDELNMCDCLADNCDECAVAALVTRAESTVRLKLGAMNDQIYRAFKKD